MLSRLLGDLPPELLCPLHSTPNDGLTCADPHGQLRRAPGNLEVRYQIPEFRSAGRTARHLNAALLNLGGLGRCSVREGRSEIRCYRPARAATAKAVVLMRAGTIRKRGKTFTKLVMPPGTRLLGEDSLGSVTGPSKGVTVTWTQAPGGTLLHADRTTINSLRAD